MPKPKPRGRHVGPRSYSKHHDLIVPPVLRDVLDNRDDDPQLYAWVLLNLAKAHAAGQDPSDPATATWIVAETRAELAEKRAGGGDGPDPFAAA